MDPTLSGLGNKAVAGSVNALLGAGLYWCIAASPHTILLRAASPL